jgi:hypothetical protein
MIKITTATSSPAKASIAITIAAIIDMIIIASRNFTTMFCFED